MLGAPGSGKGTLASKICELYRIPHISTGEILRNEVKNETPIGIEIKEIMTSGKLVPDSLIIDITKNRISESDCKNGFILDGFPRTIEQAKALEKITSIDLVVSIRISNEKVVERIAGRRTCPTCGEIYHTSWHKENTCSKCNSKLVQRDDEKTETVLDRLVVFEKQTAPLVQFYEKMGNLIWVDSGNTAEETFREFQTKLS